MKLLEVRNLKYSYRDGKGGRDIFEGAQADFEAGKFYTLLGESGSGKTTFLSIISGQDGRYQGEVLYKGKEIKSIGLDRYRRTGVSMIFQNYNLITHLNAVDNIKMAMDISENVDKIETGDIYKTLEEFGIDKKTARRKVASLSGGEQQRVSIVRSIMTDTDIIVADEPTGNLDYKNSGEVIDIFQKLAHDRNKCVIMVTHNEKIGQKGDEVYRIDQLSKKLIKDRYGDTMMFVIDDQ